MKTNLLVILACSIFAIFSACEKDDKDDFKATASIIVINASVGNGSVKVNPRAGSGFSYAKASDIAYGASSAFGAFVGNHAITVVSSTDTTKTMFRRDINLPAISTLYLAGQTPTVDSIYRTEPNLPYIQSAKLNPDSSLNVRFVNLSPNSPAVNVTLGASTTNEFANIAYKGISGFKNYKAPLTATNYVFNIRDAATNIILTSITLNSTNNRFKTLSIIMRGLVGGTGATALGTFQVNYFN